MTFNRAGAVTSIKERGSGRELARKGVFLFAESPGRCIYPNRLESAGDGRYRWIFPRGGAVTLKAGSFGPGWIFEVSECDVPDIHSLYFGWVHPICTNWTGRILNMISDERSGVIVRSGEPETAMAGRGDDQLFLYVRKNEAPFVGRRGGIVAGPRGRLQEALRMMTGALGAYHTDCSGAWALGNRKLRGSYLFAEVSAGSLDDWIDLAERCGFDTIHMHNAGSRGHFKPTSVLYPRGYEDFALCADLIRKAGLRVGMHTLTGCINPRDAWITPVCSTDLTVRCTHTLSRPLSEGDTEMLVDEMPEADHDTIHSYASNGNTLLVGRELVQYTGIRRTPPYAFTGIRRGAFGTRTGGGYPAGTKVKYLLQRYDAFYPAPGTGLAADLAEAIATAFHTGKIDMIYFDGSEGLGSRYAIDSVRTGIARKLGGKAVIEGSHGNRMNWWYLSRYGAWDHSVWGAKLFQDQHSRDVELIRKGNLLEPQMGWWKPRQADVNARGHFLDEMEYFAAKNAAVDASMSLQGVDMRRQRLTPFSITRQLTVLGWYERLRLAKAFTPAALKLFGEEGADARLRQREDGRWMCRRSDAFSRRIAGYNGGEWTVKAENACEAAIRIEALYAADRTAEPVRLVSASDRFSSSGAAEPKVEAFLGKGSSPYGETLVLSARNRGRVMRGAWAAFEWSAGSGGYRDAKGPGGIALWVKGDGKGETLCLQLGSGREYSSALSDHYVKIDFTGWRYIEFQTRERDAGRMEEFVWPYSSWHNMRFIAAALDMRHIGKVGFYLNGIAPGEDVRVEVSAVEVRPSVKNVTKGATVSVNGGKIPVPFDMESGEYAELEDGYWILYSENGMPRRKVPGPRPGLAAGENRLKFDGRSDVGPARSEVTLFALGKPFPATVDLSALAADDRRNLSCEAAMPVFYAPSGGFDGKFVLPVRPGEKAFVELRITGPVARPSISFGSGKWTVPVELGAEDRLFCRDAVNWYVLRQSGLDSSKIVSQGRFREPLPTLRRSIPVTLGSSDPGAAAAEFDITKRYGGERHPGEARLYLRGRGVSGEGDTEGILNSNWKAREN